MLCPKCSGLLDQRVSQSVEVDVCVDCGGIWLDRGELDKLLADKPVAPQPPPLEGEAVFHDRRSSAPVVDERTDRGRKDKSDTSERPSKNKKSEKKPKSKKKKKKKKGWGDKLEDIFDDVLDL